MDVVILCQFEGVSFAGDKTFFSIGLEYRNVVRNREKSILFGKGLIVVLGSTSAPRYLDWQLEWTRKEGHWKE